MSDVEQQQRPAQHPVVPAAPHNVFAIIALVGAFVMPLAGIVFGHLALNELKVKPERGREMAIAGLALGYTFSGLILLFLLIWFGFFFAIMGTVFTTIPLVTSFS